MKPKQMQSWYLFHLYILITLRTSIWPSLDQPEFLLEMFFKFGQGETSLSFEHNPEGGGIQSTAYHAHCYVVWVNKRSRKQGQKEFYALPFLSY